MTGRQNIEDPHQYRKPHEGRGLEKGERKTIFFLNTFVFGWCCHTESAGQLNAAYTILKCIIQWGEEPGTVMEFCCANQKPCWIFHIGRAL